MENLINRLPFDILFFHIIPFTYNVQNKTLLHDIVNYHETKLTLLKLYYHFWVEQAHHDEPEDKNWLINDIFAYANNDVAGMYGRVEQFYNIFKRNKFLQTNEKIDNYLHMLERKHVTSQINIFLGLLTPKERNDVIIAFPIRNIG
jgi:hypothetical protein